MKNSIRFLLTSLAMMTFGLVSCSHNAMPDINPSHNNDKYVTSVELSSEYEECEIGDSFTLSATIHYKDDQVVEDITKLWKSSKPSVAKITEDGENCLVEVVGSGTAFITFRAGYEQASCKVYVPESETPVDPDPDPDPQEGSIKITLSATSRTLEVGSTFSITASTSPAAEMAFSVSNTSVLELVSSIDNGCTVKGLAAGNADIVVTAGDSTAKCHVTVVDAQEQGDKDYTIYFYIDYNNVDPTDKTGTKLLSSFDWYYDRPLIEAKDDDGNSLIPAVSDAMALDPAFPYFVGWSTHPIIDTKENLWDLNKDTVADLPMASYTVILYGQWMDVPVLNA